jgi:hypothetical protein
VSAFRFRDNHNVTVYGFDVIHPIARKPAILVEFREIHEALSPFDLLKGHGQISAGLSTLIAQLAPEVPPLFLVASIEAVSQLHVHP